MHFICFAPEHSRRFQFWQKAIKTPCKLITYEQLYNNEFQLNRNTEYCVRIESPGEDENTTSLLEELGGLPLSHKKQYGECTNYDAWYRGWRQLLNKIKALALNYSFHFLNAPEDIALVFDKLALHKRLNKKVAMPTLRGQFRTLEELLPQLHQGYDSVFIKSRYGSSASGVIALRKTRDKLVAYTSLKKENNHLFNSLRLQRYHSWQELNSIFQLANTEFIIEDWLPKLSFNGQSVDFRVLTIYGKAEFIVPRQSQHMITNIHLGGQKMSINHFSKSLVDNVTQLAEKTANTLPYMMYSGIDILVDTKQNTYLLEVNAFGDMLLDIKNKDGLNPYEAEFKSLNDKRFNNIY